METKPLWKSRKVIIAVLTMLVTIAVEFANVKFSMGLSTETIMLFMLPPLLTIMGIAYEDASIIPAALMAQAHKAVAETTAPK